MVNHYLVYSCEQSYGGLHGMWTAEIFYGELKDAYSLARENSICVMEDYEAVYETLEQEACEMFEEENGYFPNEDERTSESFNDFYQALAERNMEYSVYKILPNGMKHLDEIEQDISNTSQWLSYEWIEEVNEPI